MHVQPIVVGVDFAEPSLAAARWTARHLLDGKLVLAHSVWVPDPPPFLSGYYPPTATLIEDATRGTKERLRELAATLERPAEAAVTVGRPEDTLPALAEEMDARLLVIGSHGPRSGVWKLLGSTAERIARRSRRPLLLARNLPEDGMRVVLVAVDDSGFSPAMLEWIPAMTRHDRARVVVVHVISPMLAGFVKVAASSSEITAADRQLRQHGEAWLRGEIEQAGISAVLDVAVGDVCFELLRAASRHAADLIILGSHDPRRGRFLGSTAEFVLRQGPGPVLVTRASAAG
ncbi:MAG: universal stress protein [Gemmatimonadaceae bacterium]|nr:universal stress protein [Gemmatimonadaceae bacterium]